MKHIDTSRIKTLYLIGNGFDLHHGLRSSYSNFVEWLRYNHPMLFNEFVIVYGEQVLSGEWWEDFENSLGELDIVRYYNQCHTEIPERIWQENQEQKGSGLPNSPSWYPAAKRLSSLYFVLDAVMKQWIGSLTFNTQKSDIITLPQEDTFYLTFNYTNTLEYLYDIPGEKILHIHGCLSNGDDLIFGHGKDVTSIECQYEDAKCAMPHSLDMQKISLEFNKKRKRPEEYMHRNRWLFYTLKNLQDVYIYGLSLSKVDIPYVEQIRRQAPTAKWHISYHREEDIEKTHKQLNSNGLFYFPDIHFFEF